MAVVQTGSILRFVPARVNADTVSTTITVPADAELVVVNFCTWNNTTTGFISGGGMTFTKGGVDTAMTAGSSLGDASTSAFMGAQFYLAMPDTGANQTLKYDLAGTNIPGTDVLCTVIFYTGVDTSSPVRSTGGGQNSTAPYTTGTLTCLSGDLILAMAFGSVSSVEGTIDTWSNLTLLDQTVFDADADMALATNSPSGDTTVGTVTDTTFADGGIVALVLKPFTALVSTPGTAQITLTGYQPVSLFPRYPNGTPIWLYDVPFYSDPNDVRLLDPTVLFTAGGGTTVLPGFGQLILTGFTPTYKKIYFPGFGSVLLTGLPPTLKAAVNTGFGSILLTGLPPNLRFVNFPGFGSLILTGFNPVAFTSGGSGVTVLPGFGSLLLTGFTPTYRYDTKPGFGSIVLSGLPPTLKKLVNPGSGQLILTGAGPALLFTLKPGFAELLLSGFPPTAINSGDGTPAILIIHNLPFFVSVGKLKSF